MINSVTNAATFGRKMNRPNGRMNFYLSITGKQFYNGRRDLCVPFHFFFFFIWNLRNLKKFLNSPRFENLTNMVFQTIRRLLDSIIFAKFWNAMVWKIKRLQIWRFKEIRRCDIIGKLYWKTRDFEKKNT